MTELSTQEKEQIAIEMLEESPLTTVCQLALLKMAHCGIETNAEESTLFTEATIEGKRYKCEMVVTWEEV